MSDTTPKAFHACKCSCCGRDIHQTVSYVRENFFKGPSEYAHACHELDKYITSIEAQNTSLRRAHHAIAGLAARSTTTVTMLGNISEEVLDSLPCPE